jgi:hypothetical protein
MDHHNHGIPRPYFAPASSAITVGVFVLYVVRLYHEVCYTLRAGHSNTRYATEVNFTEVIVINEGRCFYGQPLTFCCSPIICAAVRGY